MIIDLVHPHTFLPFSRNIFPIGTPIPRNGEIIVVPGFESKAFEVKDVSYDYQDPNNIRIIIEVI